MSAHWLLNFFFECNSEPCCKKVINTAFCVMQGVVFAFGGRAGSDSCRD